MQWTAEPPVGAIIQESAEDLLTVWGKLKLYIAAQIEQEDSTWADEAGLRLQEELEQLETYYDSLLLDSKDESELLARDKRVRIQELKWRTLPKIQVEPIFMALLYMESAWARTQLNSISELA
ncbi:MAG: hypothetical protein JWN30_1751 [Bacilli bacterium]|nr:hypothetical protein [Bacilli bacterium]